MYSINSFFRASSISCASMLSSASAINIRLSPALVKSLFPENFLFKSPKTSLLFSRLKSLLILEKELLPDLGELFLKLLISSAGALLLNLIKIFFGLEYTAPVNRKKTVKTLSDFEIII